MSLTDAEKREIFALVAEDKPLPDHYRCRLFSGGQRAELVWQGKNSSRHSAVHPLEMQEQYCATQKSTTAQPQNNCGVTPGNTASACSWNNILFHGDNRELLSSLLHGPMRNVIEAHGGIKLIYIDPPFDVGMDFTAPLAVLSEPSESDEIPGEQKGKRGKRPPLRTLAYSDIWGQGADSFLCMLHERLLLMRDLLADDGSLYVHCDWRTAAHLRLVLDEIFGAARFLGDIAWHYTGGGRSSRYFSRKHDRILHYAKTDRWIFNVDAIRVPYTPTSGYAKGGITSAAGKHYTPNPLGTPVDDVWRIPMINPLAKERLDYPTQKPEALLERIIKASSREGDLVADFFCGSGTSLAVAHKLGRKWIGADAGPLAIHTCRKRLIHGQAPFLLARTHAGGHAGDVSEKTPETMSETTQAAQPAPALTAMVQGQKLCYTFGNPQLLVHASDTGFSLELTGFTIEEAVAAPSTNLDTDAPARGHPRLAIQDGALVREGDADFPAQTIIRDWSGWIDFWSVSLPGRSGKTFPALPGCYTAPLAGNILWQSSRPRNSSCLALRTQEFSWDCGLEEGTSETLPLSVAVTLVDVFANETRFAVPAVKPQCKKGPAGKPRRRKCASPV